MMTMTFLATCISWELYFGVNSEEYMFVISITSSIGFICSFIFNLTTNMVSSRSDNRKSNIGSVSSDDIASSGLIGAASNSGDSGDSGGGDSGGGD